MWSFLVSPYVWITLLQSHGGGYDEFLTDPHRFTLAHRFTSAIVLALGLIAVGAALAMSRSRKIGVSAMDGPIGDHDFDGEWVRACRDSLLWR